jgi:5-hydroxyisourate hydrolase-like protein (transthyretin family)
MTRSVLALLILSIAGCGITDSGVTLRIQGTVLAQATGQPVAGARINLYPSFIQEAVATTTTDSQGRYSITQKMDNCNEDDFGPYVGASASGFDSNGVNALCNSALQQINFSLAPPTMP